MSELTLHPASAQAKFYQDFRELNALKSASHVTSRDALTQVAHQFESLFLQTIMKTARETTAALNEDSLFSSNETQFYQEMLDNQWSVELSAQQGLGVADLIVRQMARYLPEDD